YDGSCSIMSVARSPREAPPVDAMTDPAQLRDVQTLIDVPLGIGESPLWDHRQGVLWFIDIEAPAIFRYRPAQGELKRFETPETVASLGLAPADRLVVALRSGVYLFDPSTGKYEFLVHPEPNRATNRLNDGRVG